ncbi:507_t:CDS:2 [Racocetra fulgida]|uniref:507_t:CDS:1 n=1 Tax=Racocetra fulgida TaxID=60492 RepID=A0A9N9FAG4_9GLOM|nr:507_t:CDS:2 [Racocetra fulgida]
MKYIENAIKELAETHVANLQPNHELGKNEKQIILVFYTKY